MDGKDLEGMTALAWSSMYGHASVARTLVLAGKAMVDEPEMVVCECV